MNGTGSTKSPNPNATRITPCPRGMVAPKSSPTEPGAPSLTASNATVSTRFGHGKTLSGAVSWQQPVPTVIPRLHCTLYYAGEKGQPFFVVFTAILVGDEIFEKGDGGVLVRPLETLAGPMPRSEFQAKWLPALDSKKVDDI